MKSVALTGIKRTERGSTDANSLRKQEKIPCVIYGGKENILFTVEELKFNKLINTHEVHLIDLDIDGAKFKAIIKDVQFHPVTDKTIHVDFLEISENKPVMMQIPVTVVGVSKGVLNGGKLRMVTRRLKVVGLPSALPETIELDITSLKIGQSIKVSEIKIEGLTFLDSANSVVVAVKVSRVALLSEEEEAAEAAAAEAAAAEEGGAEASAEATQEETAATE